MSILHYVSVYDKEILEGNLFKKKKRITKIKMKKRNE